ncbi:MAG: hypothetical protein ACMXYF_00550 [Candidatus Woesearchaeota archaeon]
MFGERVRLNTRAVDDRSTGAPFVIVLTLLIIFYILFLPPGDRASLLGENGPSGPGTPSQPSQVRPGESLVSLGSGDSFVFEGPGRVTVQAQNQYEHMLSTFALRGEYEAQILAERQSVLVSRSLFERQDQVLQFSMDSPHQNARAVLDFGAGSGLVTVTHNENTVFQGPITQPGVVIDLPRLYEKNELRVQVESPGFAFWTKNQYPLRFMRVQADVLEQSTLDASQSFSLRPIEIQNLNSARLRFFAECQSDVGKLTVYINQNRTFSNVVDCGNINVISIAKSKLVSGQNVIDFELDYGVVLLDQIRVLTDLHRDEGLMYYFDLNPDLFLETSRTTAVCGEVDGVCPSGCSALVDKDCCFANNPNAYWCPTPTALLSDRCVGFVDQTNVDRCPSGYEDRQGRVPSDFRGICGDNNDGVCPEGCLPEYDKDCCFKQDGFWCSDMPVGGVSNVCIRELTQDTCPLCPSGYRAPPGKSTLSCTPESRSLVEDDISLKTEYRILAEFRFVEDGSRNNADVQVNGHTFTFDTYRGLAQYDISRFVNDYTNYLQIIPRSEFSLVQTRIRVERR